MLYRSRIIISLILFFIVLFPTYSFAESKKSEFISEVLSEIKKAKKEVGNVAKSIPNSLVLAQAIHESEWGNSRIAKNKKNIFGIKRGKKYAHFAGYKDGIKYYLNTLAKHDSYRKLRNHLGSNSLILVRYLDDYAKDPRYEEKIERLIRENNLMSFDV